MEPQPQKSIVLPIAVTVLVSAIVFGGLGYYLADNQSTDTTTTVTPSQTTQASPTATPTSTTTTKKVEGSRYTFNVPATWSVGYVGEFSESAPDLSVGSKDLMYGDTNWEQVDFFHKKEATADLVATAKRTFTGGTWSKETVGGISADVYTHPLDNGQVTKGGTGGKEYYISVPQPNLYFFTTLVITKQAKGDAAFEDGFKTMISTMAFEK